MTIVLVGLAAITLLAIGGIAAVVWSVVTCPECDEHPAAQEDDTTAQTVANVIIAHNILD